MHRFSEKMQKKVAILTALVLAILGMGLCFGTVPMQPEMPAATHAVFSSTQSEKSLPLSYGGLTGQMPDMTCEHQQMQNDAGVSTSRINSLRHQQRLFRLLCAQFTRISRDRVMTAFAVTESVKAAGHHCHRVLLTSCCMRC